MIPTVKTTEGVRHLRYNWLYNYDVHAVECASASVLQHFVLVVYCRIEMAKDQDSGVPSRIFQPSPCDWRPLPINGTIRVEFDRSSVSFDNLCRRSGTHVHCTVITNGNGITTVQLAG